MVVKKQLEENNEIVLILPYYENADKVREVLSEGFIDIAEGNGDGKEKKNNNKIGRIDVGKYEK